MQKSPAASGSTSAVFWGRDIHYAVSLVPSGEAIQISSTRSKKTALTECMTPEKQTTRPMFAGSMQSIRVCRLWGIPSSKILLRNGCIATNLPQRLPEDYRRSNVGSRSHPRIQSIGTSKVRTDGRLNTIETANAQGDEERSHGLNRGRIESLSI